MEVHGGVVCRQPGVQGGAVHAGDYYDSEGFKGDHDAEEFKGDYDAEGFKGVPGVQGGAVHAG